MLQLAKFRSYLLSAFNGHWKKKYCLFTGKFCGIKTIMITYFLNVENPFSGKLINTLILHGLCCLRIL